MAQRPLSRPRVQHARLGASVSVRPHPSLIPPQILRLFSPDLGPADVLTGGQFFAALRLVSHVLGGKEMDPSLVFIQGVLSNASYTSLSRFVKCSTTHGISYCAMGSFPPSSSMRVQYSIIARTLLYCCYWHFSLRGIRRLCCRRTYTWSLTEASHTPCRKMLL